MNMPDSREFSPTGQYDRGYKDGTFFERRRHNRYAWNKLFACMFVASFLAFATLWTIVTLL